MRIDTSSLSLLLILGCVSFSAFAQTPGIDRGADVGYVIDSRGNVVKSGTGLCWRTGYWTPAMAIAECDPELVMKATPKTRAVPEPANATRASTSIPKPTAEKITLAADTLFDFDKAVLRPEGKVKLDDLVAKVKNVKIEVILAAGHADRFGTDKYNQKLSENRAQAVKVYLVSKGVEPNRIYAEGKGKQEPVTKPGQCRGPKSKKVIACLQPDRRVDIEVIGTKTPNGM